VSGETTESRRGKKKNIRINIDEDCEGTIRYSEENGRGEIRKCGDLTIGGVWFLRYREIEET